MEFRSPNVAAEQNSTAMNYLTRNLANPAAGRAVFNQLLSEMGNVVKHYPDWHPFLTEPPQNSREHITSLGQLEIYQGTDHTAHFVGGFVTCPYHKNDAERLVQAINQVPSLNANRLQVPLYHDDAYPVVVKADEIVLEADGTIRSRDALAWCSQRLVKHAREHQVAETWWNIRSNILGTPHGSRSSLFVNQHTGGHMRKILEALNSSGMYGPIKEWSLEMLSEKKRQVIAETLIRAAVTSWNKIDEGFEFELRGETCKADIRDTWGNSDELSIRVEIGDTDLYAQGFYYAKDDSTFLNDPVGKRAVAEKFL